jgi:phosphoglycerol transferase MdoB-like AlkP superfamily enzyme
VFVLLFRIIDHYYYATTKAPLNAYVLYSNMTMIQEGQGIVFAAPSGLLVTLTVIAHYLAYVASSRYAAFLARVARGLRARRSAPVLAVLAAAVLLLAIDAHALLVNRHKRYALTDLSGEYQFLHDLPKFLQQEQLATNQTATRPARLYLPAVDGVAALASAPVPSSAAARRPDVFIVTVESFNALYTVPARELNPALSDDIMPFFRSLGSEGTMFSHAYTSAAYTFNGIVSVLCSQYTLNEIVWGRGCLPETLQRNGYEPFSLISIQQLRPYRYVNFKQMGFDRTHVFDAISMRQGKKNVFFDFLTDKELFDFGAALADSVARRPVRKPIFMHISTNQMHAPGMFSETTCKPYPFPPSLQIDGMTRSMLNSARCTDRDLAKFIADLKRSGLYDESIVVITADHAFNIAFWDHKESELARIPLFVKLPRSAPAALDAEQLVGQIDLAPTILAYVGLRPERAMYGRSILGAPDTRRTIAGISSSRLLSLASRDGVAFHVRGQSDAGDGAVREELDALFDTVLYFDQHPDAYESAVRTAAPGARWPRATVAPTIASAPASH